MSSSQASPNYTHKDMEDCIQPLGNPFYQMRFLATFQGQHGFPKPTAASKKLVNVAVEFVHKRSTVIRNDIWKLPQGAISIAVQDRNFSYLLMDAYTYKHYDYWESTFRGMFPCESCKRPSNQIKVTRLWDTALKKMAINVGILCMETTCLMKYMEGHRQNFKQLKKDMPALKKGELIYCANCHKKESIYGPKFLGCGKCKMSMYCSKECQVQHWKAGHKQECKEHFRGKLKEKSRHGKK